MDDGDSILFIDAYDSFSQNVVALLRQALGAHTTVVKIDANIESTFNLNFDDFVAQFDAVVIGPGPGDPNKACDVGILYRLLDTAATQRIPVLGICLGFQVLCVKYGLRIERMKDPCHGHSKKIILVDGNRRYHTTTSLFRGVDASNIWATCYNSLGLTLHNANCDHTLSRPGSSGTNASFSSTDSLISSSGGTALSVLAVDMDDNVMAIEHRQLPFWGIQFHPESCKSNEACHQIVRNWWLAAKACNKRLKRCHGRNLSRSLSRNCRLPIFKPVSLVGDRPENCEQAGTSAAETILSQLLRASTTTGNIVQYLKAKFEGGSDQISKYIHEISGQHAVAMLESTKKGRFSIYAVLETQNLKRTSSSGFESESAWQLHYQQSRCSISRPCSQTRSLDVVADRDSLWMALEAFLVHKKAVSGPSEIPFWGGFIGYLSYEHGLSSLGVKSDSAESQTVSESSLVWVERSVVYDNSTNTVYVQSIRKNDGAFIQDFIHRLSILDGCASPISARSTASALNLQSMLNTAQFELPQRDRYYSQFYQCQSELHAGNSYELCLTTDAIISIPNPQLYGAYEFDLYKNLHAHNPVPFGAFLKLGGVTILGTSPEQYMSWSRDSIIDMIPMKGTVKRSTDMTFERASSILSSPKESAENLMIADLIRHDLYTAVGCDSNVEVVKLCEVIEHETVYQLVSHIRAHAPLRDGLTNGEKQERAMHYGLKALRQTIPPGSMTGAPKKRSCEILSGLEQRNRGVYSGVLGYMDVGGGGNWNVCIRTAFHCGEEGKIDGYNQQDIWHLGAGGAITVLSTAEGEWQEMMVKLNSVLQGFRTVKI